METTDPTPKPLSFRQKEFARLYASGQSAHDAARAAGYAESTIESNTPRLLSSRRIAALIERYRNSGRLVGKRQLTLCVQSLERVLLGDPDANQAIRATRLLLSLYQAQARQGITCTDEPDTAPSSSSATPAAPDTFADRIESQLPGIKQYVDYDNLTEDQELALLERSTLEFYRGLDASGAGTHAHSSQTRPSLGHPAAPSPEAVQNQRILDERRRQRNALGRAAPVGSQDRNSDRPHRGQEKMGKRQRS